MPKHFEPDAELSEICNKLWEVDDNRLTPEKDYAIDLQGYTKAYRAGKSDYASDPLFAFVDEEKLYSIPTFKRFIALLDNYESDTGVGEQVTEEEEAENWAFIDAIMETRVMQEAHQYLVGQGKASQSADGFKRELYNLWFRLYRRTRGNRNFDSSGFEHVFVGETRGERDVIGFHNWVQFYLQEKRGHVDYKGWIPLGRNKRKDSSSQLVTIQFSWKESVKPVGSTFVGTSPEFEIALYTVLFLCHDDDKTHISLDDEYHIEIVCYHHGRNLGTSYPVALFQVD